MTLGFSTNFPDGNLTLFEQKILLPYKPELRDQFPDLLPKIHTFRVGDRWRAGMKLHMVTGNRTKQRRQFNDNIPELQTCIAVQDAFIHRPSCGKLIIWIGRLENGRYLNYQEHLLFAANDGFNSLEEMNRWFPGEWYAGQIVHWTDFQYELAPAAPEKEIEK